MSKASYCTLKEEEKCVRPTEGVRIKMRHDSLARLFNENVKFNFCSSCFNDQLKIFSKIQFALKAEPYKWPYT